MAAAVPSSFERATEGVKSSAALDFLKRPKQLLIGGKWILAKSGKTFETINPANEEVLALVAEGDKADVDEAVKAARKAFEEGKWSAMGPHQRSRYLLKLADLVDKYADELAELESLDNGKPVSQARSIDVNGVAGVLRYFAGWPTKIYGETNPSDPSFFNYTLREPIGVCGLIVPWNFPLMMAINKIAPALACGNTVVLKPGEQTPLTAIRFGEIVQEAGIPDGVVNIITGFGPGAGSSIAEHPDIDKISFTGSTEVGKIILQASAGNLKRVSLELGGKSPNIIFSDADQPLAVRNAMNGVFYNSGQVCAAGTRIFVQRDIYDNFVADLTSASERMTLGDPLDPKTKLGPVVSCEQFDKVKGYLEVGKQEGARITIGGGAREGKGYFIKPTIFADVTNSMKIAREEIFGPVAAAIPFKDEHDAVFQGNDTTTVWPPQSGLAISAGRIELREHSRRELCGSTATA
ncbi:MAG TPA: aldehyde dehydrogenase family protein [Candidatus Binataceae bacterium]|nr:aldehyde dehydrogenase family protein [Candidatus Binataceae bacterium]